MFDFFTILDLTGRHKVILEAVQPADHYMFSFDELKFYGLGYSDGFYIFKLMVDGQIHTLKALKLNR